MIFGKLMVYITDDEILTCLVTLNRSRVEYLNWSRGEPNNGGNGKPENCAMNSAGSGQWNDFPCDTKFSFICKVRG